VLAGRSVGVDAVQRGGKDGFDAASNGRTVRVWNRNGTSIPTPPHSHPPFDRPVWYGLTRALNPCSADSYMHSDRARWDSTLTLNADFAFQIAAPNPTPEHPSSDKELDVSRSTIQCPRLDPGELIRYLRV